MKTKSQKKTLELVLKDQLSSDFSDAYESWKHAICSVTIRFFAVKQNENWSVKKASIDLQSFLPAVAWNEKVETESVLAGHVQKNLSGAQLDDFVLQFLDGRFEVFEITLEEEKKDISFYSNRTWPEPTVFNKRLDIRKPDREAPDPSIHLLNHELRTHSRPFDGLNDLFSHFGFSDSRYHGKYDAEIVMVAPLEVAACDIQNGHMSLELRAGQALGIDTVFVGIIATTSTSENVRLDITSKVEWKLGERDRKGMAHVHIEAVTSVQVLLSVNGQSASRTTYLDAAHRPNSRLAKYLPFDPGLGQLKDRLFKHERKADLFEKAIAVLLWLLGFNPVSPTDTDAPDILLESPKGKLVIVECTIGTKDIRTKIGKLVDRRSHFVNTVKTLGSAADILAVLVVNLPRNQVADEREYLEAQQVILLTDEDIHKRLERIEFPTNPDNLITDALQKLASKRNLV